MFWNGLDVPEGAHYKDNNVIIYNADCFDLLDRLPRADLILTDPPYGINAHCFRPYNNGKGVYTKDYGPMEWNRLLDPAQLQAVINKGEYQIIFGGNYYNLPSRACWLVWNKNNSGDFADCELAWSNLTGSNRLFTYSWNGMIRQDMKNREPRYHPTQKPVPLFEWCILQAEKKQHRKIDLIIDPFMGSGPAVIAAKRLNKRAIGIELSAEYCDETARRLFNEVLQIKGESWGKLSNLSRQYMKSWTSTEGRMKPFRKPSQRSCKLRGT